MNTLPVRYVSQITSGALEHFNDCGSASALMLLTTYNLANGVTVDAFYNSIHPSGDAALSAGDMQAKMSALGLVTDWKVDMTMEAVYGALRNRKPLIALIHYGSLVDAGVTEKSGFKEAHFLVVTGIDLESVYVNDPYRTDNLTNIAVPISVFELAWSKCYLEHNPNGGALIPRLPIQDLSIIIPGDKYELTVNGINVRAEPSSISAFVRTIWKSNEPTIYASGKVVNGYIRLADLTGWVYSAYLRRMP